VGEALSCSPKSIYHLAQLLRLHPLTDLAYQDIISKLTSDNIVAELFATVTAHNDRLLEKQCLLLTSTLKTPVTTAAVQQHVQEMASGPSPHCYDALRLAFGYTVDAIKQERQKITDERNEFASRPRLKCRNRPSDRCNKEISIDDQRGGSTGRYCGNCSGVFECSTCGLVWRGNDVCRDCKKAFR